jgi:hypothetical protein
MVGLTIRDEPRVGVGFRGYGLHKKVRGSHVGGRAGEGGRSQPVYFAYPSPLTSVGSNAAGLSVSGTCESLSNGSELNATQAAFSGRHSHNVILSASLDKINLTAISLLPMLKQVSGPEVGADRAARGGTAYSRSGPGERTTISRVPAPISAEHGTRLALRESLCEYLYEPAT